MSYYVNNQTDTAATAVGTFSPPLAVWYWWEAGAVWGGLIDYWAYTGDTSFNPTVTQALLAQVGTNDDFMPSAYAGSMGNDDQAFWAASAMSAMEYGYPEPSESGNVTWQGLGEAVFNNFVSRWDTTQCGGGLKWQVFSANAGYDYKNTISNAGFFQLAARLARFTGNATYYDWAEKTWDWMSDVGLISTDYNSYDGADDTLNCSSLDQIQWTYNAGMLLYGAASLYNYTGGSSEWETRTTGLVKAAEDVFFNKFSNSTGIMVEQACEPYNTCDDDQFSFKGYLARWMGKTAILAPFTETTIMPLLTASAKGAAKACSGPSDGVTCGSRWYTGGFDGSSGIGQQLSALEVTQALLVGDAPAILTGGEITIRSSNPSSNTTTSSSSLTSTSTTMSVASTNSTVVSLASSTSTTHSLLDTTTSVNEYTKNTNMLSTTSSLNTTSSVEVSSPTTKTSTTSKASTTSTASITSKALTTSTKSTSSAVANEIVASTTSEQSSATAAAAPTATTSSGATPNLKILTKKSLPGINGVVGLVVGIEAVLVMIGLGFV